MKLSDKAYDILKWIAIVALDALGVCYAAVADVWGLPFGNEIVRTCAAASIMIGSLIGISSANVNRNK